MRNFDFVSGNFNVYIISCPKKEQNSNNKSKNNIYYYRIFVYIQFSLI
jgi:hypothetical protein